MKQTIKTGPFKEMDQVIGKFFKDAEKFSDSLNNSKDLENKVTTAENEMSYRDCVEENY